MQGHLNKKTKVEIRRVPKEVHVDLNFERVKKEEEEKMNTNKDDNLNESMTVVGIEMQSNASEASTTPTTTTNESESTSMLEYQIFVPSSSSAVAAAAAAVDNDSPTESIDLNSGDDEGIGDIMDDELVDGRRLEGFQLINLQPEIKVAVADEMPMLDDDENDADTLSPLVVDNHVFVEHCEMMKHRNREIPGLYDHFEDECENDDELDDDEEENTANVSLTSASSPSSSPLKVAVQPTSLHLKKDSFSSDSGDDVEKATEDAKQDRRLSSASDDNKDSGCDAKNNKVSSSDEDLPVEIPDDDFCEKIAEQVEFYFSDDSLLRDAFLLKHVRRNKEGFVSLKLVSSFKRVRALTKDWRVVGIAIKRKSKKIELNDIETKIRRIDALPLYDETMPSRTVVATNLPFDKLSIEKVSDIFSKCGEIALVRILRPNAPIPADVRQFVNKHPELQQNECALVEFTESSSARRAQNMDGIVVFELVLPKKKTGKKAVNMTKMIENFKYNSESENERSRGGENINANRFYLKRNNSAGHFIRSSPIDHHQQILTPSPRKMSLGNAAENSGVYTPPFNSFYPPPQQQQQQQYYEIPARRMSNTCHSPTERKFSDGYVSGYENSRRPSLCSDVQRRLSNVGSEIHAVPPTSPQSRRLSLGCVEYCSCGSNSSRRSSAQYSSDSYRRFSNASMSDYSRRFSNASSNFGGERKFSNTSIASSAGHQCDSRRVSYERKNSMNLERKYSSNGFDPMRKLSTTSDCYINGRKISTDSGYDRRLSINSITYDNENPITRSRNNSLVITTQCPNHQMTAEPLIRKPLGPDPDSKGFGFNRTRKIGLVGGGGSGGHLVN